MNKRTRATEHARTEPMSIDELGLEQFDRMPDDHGLSLEDLGRAYAELVGAGQVPYEDAGGEPVEEAAGNADEPVVPRDETLVVADAACELTPRSILEVMLFVGHPNNRPLESRDVAPLMRGVRPSEIADMVEELNAQFTAEQCPYEIRSVDSGYRLELRSEFAGLREKVFGRVRSARLSQPVIDVLAIVAYNQPITRERIDDVRGRPSGAILAQLVRRDVLRIDRVLDEGNRRSHFVTTDRFLALFGLSSLDELPQGQDFDRPSEW